MEWLKECWWFCWFFTSRLLSIWPPGRQTTYCSSCLCLRPERKVSEAMDRSAVKSLFLKATGRQSYSSSYSTFGNRSGCAIFLFSKRIAWQKQQPIISVLVLQADCRFVTQETLKVRIFSDHPYLRILLGRQNVAGLDPAGHVLVIKKQ